MRCAVLAYDYTVLAGTQGLFNHKKTDRLFELADEWRIPIVLFAEGGGGRPGDTDMPIVAGLHVATFASYARLSGQVPVLGIAAGPICSGLKTPSPPPSTIAGPPMPMWLSRVAMITSLQPSSAALPAKQRPATMPTTGTWPLSRA